MADSVASVVGITLMASFTFVTLFLMTAEAERLYPCDRSGYREVEENTAVTFYCDGNMGEALWTYNGPRSSDVTELATCNTASCTNKDGSRFTATYISADNSSLTSTLTSRNLTEAGGEYSCGAKACKLHVIVPAEVSKPHRSVTTTDQGYFLHCNTSIRTVYSSRGQYSCNWQFGNVMKTGALHLLPRPGDTNNTSNRTGTCDVTLPLPSDAGDFTCTVTVTPGNTRSSSDSLSIIRPSRPGMRCAPCPAPDNSSVTCTCSTHNVGQPAGRLVWYRGANDVFSQEIVRGNYDDTELSMTWPVTQADHNVTMFRCVNRWIENVTASRDFTVIVRSNMTSSLSRRRGNQSADAISGQCEISCDDCDDGDEQKGILIPAVAGGVGAAFVVVVVIVVVVMVMKKRRKDTKTPSSGHPPDGSRSPEVDSPDDDFMVVNSFYGSQESSYVGAPGSCSYEEVEPRLNMNPAPQGRTKGRQPRYANTANGHDVYAEVPKRK